MLVIIEAKYFMPLDTSQEHPFSTQPCHLKCDSIVCVLARRATSHTKPHYSVFVYQLIYRTKQIYVLQVEVFVTNLTS